MATTSKSLRKMLGVAFGLSAVIGGTIGAGILRTPGSVAALLPDAGWILAAWLGTLLFIAAGANSLAELATAVPKAGGPYVYARRAFGEFAGFVTGWADWAIGFTAISFFAVAAAEFIARLVPALGDKVHLLACAILIAVAAVNWAGLRAGSRAQEILSLAKVIAFLVLIVAFLLMTPDAGPDAELQSRSTASLDATVAIFSFGSLLLALQLIHETSSGWNSGVYFSEEDRDPGRNIPRAMFLGVFTIAAIYLSINVGLLRVLGVEGLSSSTLPVADAAQRIFGGVSDEIVTAIAIVSILGILNVTVMFSARILYALSRDGLLADAASNVSDGGSPRVAILMTTVIAMPLAAGFEFETLFSIAAFLGVVVNLTSYAALFALRIREPQLERPYVAWGYPIVPLVVVLVSVVLLVGFTAAAPFTSAAGVGVIAASYPVYAWLNYRARRPQPAPT